LSSSQKQAGKENAVPAPTAAEPKPNAAGPTVSDLAVMVDVHAELPVFEHLYFWMMKC
jgi:hypothetical protein